LLKEMLASFRAGVIKMVPSALDPLDCDAASRWSWEDGVLYMRLRYDAAQGGNVAQVIHELIHAHVGGQVEQHFRGELAEGVLRGMEAACIKWVEKHPTVYRRWRNTIARKVEAT
jgi:hypothetical protein